MKCKACEQKSRCEDCGEVITTDVALHALPLKPFVPEGWSVESHDSIKGFYPSKMELFLDDEQKNGYVKGTDLQKRLPKNVLPATVLDYLLEHQELIPEEWRGKWIYFWGTVYRDADRDLYVRCLGWGGSSWDWYYSWVVSGWSADSPCAVAS